MKKTGIAIHGGAGTILKSQMSSELEKNYLRGLKTALEAGYDILEKGGNSVDAVEKAVVELENNPLFNAGKGSVFTNTGKHEMDASIMNGKNLEAGSVCCVKEIKNPIELARKIMEESEHVMLTGDGALDFAKLVNCKTEDENYFFDDFRHKQWLEIKDTDKFQLDHSKKTPPEKFGTVGAVARDNNGNLAAATSTGGMTNKKFGRIGDSPIIGVGNYANNSTCAISCTGSGEYFLRAVVAYDVSSMMEFGGLNLEEACNKVIHDRLLKIGGDGGLIAIDQNGNIQLPFNTEGMYRAAKDNKGLYKVEIY